MQINQITFIIVSITLAISLALPIGLAIYFRKKHKTPLRTIFVGMAIWFVFSQVLEKLLHSVVLQYTPIVQTPWLFAIYLALAAGVFQEIGRYIGFTKFLKGKEERNDAIAYGIGHGGFEMLLLGGIASFQILLLANMINTGTYSQLQDKMPAEVYESIKNVLTGPWYNFAIGGVERIAAFVVQIGLSIMVLYSIRQKSYRLLIYAILIHAGIEFIPALTQLKILNIWITEGIVVLSAIAIWLYIKKSSKFFPETSLQKVEENGQQDNTDNK
jgi:uncharacterized membrane protein YhfC